MNEILPCPFCGSDAFIFTHGTTSHFYQYDIKCSDYKCYLAFGAGWTFGEPEEAIELWNKRSAG